MATQVGAFLRQSTAWQDIDWPACYKTVQRLQARIVKATEEKKWGKVKALQWILTHSFAARALAVRRVTENKGKKTPGIDGKTWSSPEEKRQAISELNRRGYRPMPLRRLHIPKANGKYRALGIPAMKDRAMQALYLLALDPVAETMADKGSYGFRSQRSTADAIASCFLRLAKKSAPQWIMEGDIQSCFDLIDHDWLLKHVPMDKQVLEKWLKSGYMENGLYHSTLQGTPQGGIISPVLANIALDGLEKLLKDTRALKGHKVYLVRYADDFIITGTSRAVLEEEVKPLVSNFLKERGLKLSEEKTQIVHIEEGFDFLGQNVRKYRGKMLIKPSKASCKSLLRKTKASLSQSRSNTCYKMVKKLNLIIRGWGLYHHHVVSKAIFAQLDYQIVNQIWRWLLRRHPNKSKGWIKQNYFEQGITLKAFQSKESKGEKKEVRLVELAKIPIIRHYKLRGEANPYSSQWKKYFEERQRGLWKKHPYTKGYVGKIWRNQSGRCPVCQQLINLESVWERHHKKPRKEGGGDELTNLVLIHPTCHKQLHSRSTVAHSI